MADNVAVTPGTGATIKTDELAGSVQIQCVKVDGGGDGLSTPILAGGGVEADALRVTIASDSTGLVSVDDNGSSLTIDAPVGTPAFVRLSDGTNPITALPVTDNGGSMTVDAPVGTPVFVRLSDGSSAITTLPVSIAASAASIGKTEDVAAASGDVGVPAMAIQTAAPANTAADGDYAMLQMNDGRLHVDGGDTQTIDAGYSLGQKGVPALALRKSTPATLADQEDDWDPLQVSAGRLWTSSVVTAASTSIGKTEDVASANGDVGVPAMAIQKATPADTAGTDGDYAMLQMSAGRVWGSDQVYGEVAHDAADSGNPVKIGAKAHAPFSLQAAVAANDRVNLSADLQGRLRVVSHPDDIVRLGVYYYHSGVLTVAAAADAVATSEGGRVWIINPVGSSVNVRIRKVTFRSQLGSALLTPTSPRFTLEKCVFTGTDSGTALTAAKRRTADASPTSNGRTASTGMDVTSAAVVTSFFPVAAASAVSYTPPAEASFDPGPEDYIDLVAGECLVLRQADAGTVSDTRRVTVDFVVEEYTP